MRYAILYIFFALFVGCKTNQVVSKVETSKSDTLIMKSEVVKRPPILSSLIINEICDTITGKPVKFKREFIIERDTILIEVVDDDLQIKYNVASSIISKQDSLYIMSQSKINELQTEIKKVNRKWAWYCLGLLLLLLIFPNIALFINKSVRLLLTKIPL